MTPYRVCTELECDECGYHVNIVDASDDAVLWITDSYPSHEDAERAASDWINKHQWPLSA